LIFKTCDPFALGGVPAAEDGGWSDKKHYPFKLSKNIRVAGFVAVRLRQTAGTGEPAISVPGGGDL